MTELISLICFAGLILIAIIAFATMMGIGRRVMGASGPVAPSGGLGNEMPRYDDPNIGSGGSFGGSFMPGNLGGGSARSGPTIGGESPRHNDPGTRSGGSFG